MEKKKKLVLKFRKQMVIDLEPDQLAGVTGGVTGMVGCVTYTLACPTLGPCTSSVATAVCTNTDDYTCTGCSSETNC